ncbi:MAG: hypothetical protein EA370_12330 [Wenzhouxiangella sp.]|nr:MAG: hypothetical protein EA370_12330 [Wenzhouxiangella sp.]
MEQEMDGNSASDQQITHVIDPAALDGGGGICLSGLAGQVHVASTLVRAIDLVDCPELVGLDLSDCPDDLRIRLVKPRRLRWIRLPRGPVGATLELELHERFDPISPLSIRGRVASFGLCADWLPHSWRLNRKTAALPVDGLFIGPPSDHACGHRAAIHLLVGPAAGNRRLAIDGRGMERLVIMETHLQHLVLHNATLALLELKACHQLESVTGHFQARHARLSACPQLGHLGGGGQQLALDNLQAENLAIAGRWLKTSMTDCATERLALQRRTRLHLDGLPTLHTFDAVEPCEMTHGHGMFRTNQLGAALGTRPGKLAELVKQELQRKNQREALAMQWLQWLALGGRGNVELSKALSALFDLAVNPVDRKAAWLVRCALASLYLHGQEGLKRLTHDRLSDVIKRGCSEWKWPVLHGEHHYTWSDDLLLYYRCRDLAITLPFRRLLESVDDIGPAWVLAGALREDRLSSIEAADCRQLLIGCLARLRLQARHKPTHHMLPRLARTLLDERDPELPGLLAQALLRQRSDHGVLLVETGIEYAKTLPEIGEELIVAGLESGSRLPDRLRAAAMRCLLGNHHDQIRTARLATA